MVEYQAARWLLLWMDCPQIVKGNEMPDILTVMDDLLTSVISAGRVPEHWLLRQSDWEEIARRFEEKEVPDLDAIGASTYKEVPVHFSELHDGAIVGIVDKAGIQTIA